MHSLKSNGDFLAQEFARIVGKKVQKDSGAPAVLNKSAMDSEFTDEAADLESEANDDSLEDDIADMLVNSADEGADMASDSLDEAVDELNAYDHHDSALDDKHANIMSGLSKIASSLRAKDESFAADVVEATALSIMGDLKKEAARIENVTNELSKIASDLESSGDDLSADMVRVTLSRIKNS